MMQGARLMLSSGLLLLASACGSDAPRDQGPPAEAPMPQAPVRTGGGASSGVGSAGAVGGAGRQGSPFSCYRLANERYRTCVAQTNNPGGCGEDFQAYFNQCTYGR